MHGSFRNIIRLSDKFAYEPATNKTLSIGLFPDGFVFAVLDNDNYRYIALEEYAVSSPKACKEQEFFIRFETFVKNHPVLNTPFQRINFAYYTPHLVLIPENLFDEQLKHKYYRFCASIPTDHKLITEHVNILNARGIYLVPDYLISFLNKMFPGCRLKHQGIAFIESTLAAQKLEPWQADVVIHLRNNFFEIILLDNQRLTYYQAFSCQTFDDVLYYLFYVLEQHKLDAAKMHLLLMGKLAMDTEDYQILAGFFNTVNFPDRNDAFKYSEQFDNIPSHFYYNLLNLVTCG